ncbi:MAG: histidinol dehydrogenase [Bacteroidales bacterium]|jgi:histidinol dehydrogenase|nr:histidinol dehydrogenase [Bacteroidales bacterium]
MNIVNNPTEEEWERLTERPDFDDSAIEARVRDIISQVRTGKDAALKRLAKEIDKVDLDDLEVSSGEYEQACKNVKLAVRDAIKTAIRNITAFHEAQKFDGIEVETSPGVKCWQKAVPIDRVGLYIPGGTAPLFSTVLMLAIPARIAGCREVIICTPTGKNGAVAPEVLFAARECGVDHVYKVGGSQAIAAMAYGTETIGKVDKIFGPGNRYVAKAKRIVSNDRVAIDMLAGPSEVMVIADDNADPSFVASDLLSQAEHGPDSQVFLICGSGSFAEKVTRETERQLAALPRKEIAAKALESSHIVVMDKEDDRIALANMYAPEHLIISVDDPWKVADRITAAGSIFLGSYSPESAGDYASGTNHTLPTSGTAVASGGVNLDSFIRKITYQQLSRTGLENLSGTITAMAEAEGLQAHANAVKIRIGAADANAGRK